MWTVALLLACSPDARSPFAADTALPPVSTVTGVPTTPSGTTDPTENYTPDGRYIGPPVLDLIEHDCTDRWRFYAEGRGIDLHIGQWVLGVHPDERDGVERPEASYAEGSVLPRPLDPDQHYSSGASFEIDLLAGDPSLGDPRCDSGIDPDRLVILLRVIAAGHADDDYCYLFGAEAEGIRDDPRYYRAYEVGPYPGASPSADCTIIAWPTEAAPPQPL